MISVIIPVHNRAHFLNKCIKSVRNQTYKDIEILVVDDHSTDGFSVAVAKATEGDERVFLLALDEERGVSAARNLGLSKAKGEWIVFLDSDDYWEENLLETLMLTEEKTQADIVIAGFDMVRKNGEVIKTSRQGEDLESFSGLEILEDYNGRGFGQFCCWGRLIKKDIIGDTSFPIGVAMAEDRIFMTHVYAKAGLVVYEPGVFFHVVLHGENAQWAGFNPKLEYREIQEFEKAREFYNSVVEDKKARRIALRVWYAEKELILRRMFKVNTEFEERELSKYYKEAVESLKSDEKFIMKYGTKKEKLVAEFIKICPLVYAKGYHLAEKYLKGIRKSEIFK